MNKDEMVIPPALELPEAPEDWYELRELTEEGGIRVPHDDPNFYEYAQDFAFPSPEAARAYIEDYVDEDHDRREEVSRWFVVRMNMEIIG